MQHTPHERPAADVPAAKRARGNEKIKPHQLNIFQDGVRVDLSHLASLLQVLPGDILRYIGEFCRYDGPHTTIAFFDALVLINDGAYRPLLNAELMRHLPSLVNKRTPGALPAALYSEYMDVKKKLDASSRAVTNELRAQLDERVKKGELATDDYAIELAKLMPDEQLVTEHKIASQLRGINLKPAQFRTLYSQLRAILIEVCRFCGQRHVRRAGGYNISRDAASHWLDRILRIGVPRTAGYSSSTRSGIPVDAHQACTIVRMRRMRDPKTGTSIFEETTRGIVDGFHIKFEDVMSIDPSSRHMHSPDDKMLVRSKELAKCQAERTARIAREKEHIELETAFHNDLALIIMARKPEIDALATKTGSSTYAYVFDSIYRMLAYPTQPKAYYMHEVFSREDVEPSVTPVSSVVREKHLRYVATLIFEGLVVLCRDLDTRKVTVNHYYFEQLFREVNREVRDKHTEDLVAYYQSKHAPADMADT